MKTADIKYSEYLSLSDKEKSEVDFWITYGTYKHKDYISTIALEDRPFIDIKLLEIALLNNNIDEFSKIVGEWKDFGEKRLCNRKTYEVIITFKYIIDKIMNFINMENEMLVSKVSGTDYSQYTEQVDFSMFPNYYSQIRTLADGDITRFEEIKQCKYSDCLTELIYRQKEDDLHKLINKSMQPK